MKRRWRKSVSKRDKIDAKYNVSHRGRPQSSTLYLMGIHWLTVISIYTVTMTTVHPDPPHRHAPTRHPCLTASRSTTDDGPHIFTKFTRFRQLCTCLTIRTGLLQNGPNRPTSWHLHWGECEQHDRQPGVGYSQVPGAITRKAAFGRKMRAR